MLRRPATEDGGTSRNDRLFGQLNYYDSLAFLRQFGAVFEGFKCGLSTGGLFERVINAVP